MRKLLLIALAMFALGLAACGGDDNGDSTSTAAEPTVSTITDPTTTATSTEETDTTSGETADLPLCDDTGSVRPCRTESGGVLEEGGANAGEVGDLPPCSQSEPPCRNPDGSFTEP